MAQLIVAVDDAPDDETKRLLGDGLDAFNDEATGTNDRRPLAVIIRDPDTGQVLGGVSGRTSLGLLFLDIFYLPGPLRGAGLGSRVLRLAEEEARRRGCRAGVLYTISFQAPGFYERNGWRAFGDIPCHPPGTSRVFMTKEL